VLQVDAAALETYHGAWRKGLRGVLCRVGRL